MRIDSHHHFWRYDPREYGWIGPTMTALQRDFLPEDLAEELSAVGIDGVVSVQARQTLAETEWLLDLADAHPWVYGVVGWVPLTDPAVGDLLDRFADRGKLCGVRHVLQDEPDDEYALRPDFDRGITAVEEHGLVYDILIFERQLPAAIALVDRHPDLFFVLDHIAKPKIREGRIEPWRSRIGELAQRDNVACKLSGLVTEATWTSWTAEQLRPYLDAVLEAFGPERLMFGSDWPVCLLASGYRQWFTVVTEYIDALSNDEREAILGETAAVTYGF